ncbi:hypothetical protein OAX78_01865 [Planctomycetota bacterium]|nr:hypothetical protein [Planctomycetota bacterium]
MPRRETTLDLVVWNSQGAKWDSFYNNCLLPSINAIAPRRDVFGGLVEAGWAPWVKSGNVRRNAIYATDSNAEWFREPAQGENLGDFYNSVMRSRKNKALWIPWVRTPAEMARHARTNSRCSASGSWFQKSATRLQKPERVTPYNQNKRPALRMKVMRTGTTLLTVFLVHLPARNRTAGADLVRLTHEIQEFADLNTPAIIVGDINFDIRGQPDPDLPDNWRLLFVADEEGIPIATHNGGKALDYAVLYEPKNAVLAQAVERWPFKLPGSTFTDRSDHSAICYTLTIDLP